MNTPPETLTAANPPDAGQKPHLILYYHTMWGGKMNKRIPAPGFELTTDRRRYRDADTVVFHIPEFKWTPCFLFPKKLPHQLWVAWSLECEEHYLALEIAATVRTAVP